MDKKITVLNDEVMADVVGGVNGALVWGGLGVAAAGIVGSAVTYFVGLGYHVAATKALNRDDIVAAKKYNKIYNNLLIGSTSAAGAGTVVGVSLIAGGVLSGSDNGRGLDG